MINRILVCLCLLVGLANAQWRSGGGSTFYWSLTGQAQKTDSLRIIQGTNMTITQSGNTVTFNGAAGAGSTANVRANTGWTSNGTTAQDTLATYYLINGKFQRQMWVDTDNDSVIIAPHDLYMIVTKDGSSILAVLSDSLGRIYSGSPTGTSIALDPTSANNASIYFRETTDNADDFFRVYFDGANDRLVFDGTEDGAGNPYVVFLDNVDIGGQGGDPSTRLILSDGSSGACLMKAANNTTGTTSTDGTVFGIDASEAPIIWNYENSAMSFATNNTLRMLISASGGVGIGATTDAQANRAKFNVLGRAVNDTLVIWSNEGNTNATGDSVAFIAGTGIINAPAFNTIPTTGYITIGGTNALNRPSGGNAVYLGPGFSFSGMGLQAGLGGYFNSNVTGRWQGITTIRSASVTSDTMLVVRNDWNSTLDSTFMVFANGDIDAGGNNFYHGANRIRAVTGDTAFVFYAGTTQVFAILADGTTADLVAGVPPTLWRNGPPQEYIWLLRIVVLLLLLLIASKVYDYAKPRIRKHKTLPGEI